MKKLSLILIAIFLCDLCIANEAKNDSSVFQELFIVSGILEQNMQAVESKSKSWKRSYRRKIKRA